jgi:polar amino acid transport system permease protein
VPLRHPGRWVAVGVLLVLIAMMVNMLITNSLFEWGVVAQYLFDATIVRGVGQTVMLTVVAMAVGIVLGTTLAVMRLSPNPVVAGTGGLYIWFFRGTPVLVQLIFWFNLAALLPKLSLGIPFGPAFFSAETNSVITPLAAAILGLGLNEAAYMAEITRAGIQSVDEGQREAAIALGMSQTLAMRRILLPQAMRVIIPPTGNETIGMLKTTSLVSVVTLADLLYTAQSIYARTYQTIPLLIVASIWYLVLTSALTYGQTHIERHFGRGSHPQQPVTLLSRLMRTTFRSRPERASSPVPPSTILDAHGGIR